MYSLGIDIGYSSVKAVVINNTRKVIFHKYELHYGKIKPTLLNVFNELEKSIDPTKIQHCAVAGSGGKIIIWNIDTVNEITSTVEGTNFLSDSAKSIFEIGGQSTRFITNINNKTGSVIKISTNTNCAAGTGSFIEQQMIRLNLPLEDFSSIALKANSVPGIAGRCSVFAKTDIIHLQQEGVPISDILLGLAYSVVRNYKGGVVKGQPIEKPVFLTGGVIANQAILTAIKDVFKLNDNDIIIDQYFNCVSAIGAAVLAKKNKSEMDFETIKKIITGNNIPSNLNKKSPYLPLKGFGKYDFLDKHKITCANSNNKIIYAGIDVGSTSTNIVLMDEDKNIIDYKYIRTNGEPVKSVEKGISELKNIKINGIGVTGSGRYMIGRLLKADVVKDEITAQSTAAVTIDKDVDTIFEIGGQDSKFISLNNGLVHDFQMNKVCAAGTGSFIEEQSEKFNIPISEFSNYSLRSKEPAELGERCTVFIENSIANCLSEGRNLDDIAAGLCYSIVKNYVNRVAIKNKVGNKIFLQGGIAYNQGIVNAFRAVTGKEITVPPFFSVTGAYGAAILAFQKMKEQPSTAKFLTITPPEEGKNKTNADKNYFSEEMNDKFFAGYKKKKFGNRKSIGIPRTFFAYSMFSMVDSFFDELGFDVILSDITNKKTIEKSHEYSLDQACYPTKLLMGHIEDLVEKSVDYIYFPNLFTANDGMSKSRKNYSCVYMQAIPKMIEAACYLNKKKITLLSPTMAFNMGKEFICENFLSIGKTLGKSRDDVLSALAKSNQAAGKWNKAMKANAAETLTKIKRDEKVFVIISKIYGVADPVLNMEIPDKLKNMGYTVISFSDLMKNDIFDEYSNLYWPFAQYELGAAKYVKEHPNFHAIILTHHCCGPDAVLNHYFKDIMQDEPYLHIEIDEHTSNVGVITRVEAFVNSLQNKIPLKSLEKKPKVKGEIFSNITSAKADTIYIQDIYPYSRILKEFYNNDKCNIKLLPLPNQRSVNRGRKHILTNEYFSLTVLLGDVFEKISKIENNDENCAFFTFQNEGADIDGQYGQILRTKLDEAGRSDIKVISPFLEDIVNMNPNKFEFVALLLLAADLIMIAPKEKRSYYLFEVLNLIKIKKLDIKQLKALASRIFLDINDKPGKTKLLATGEPIILFGNYLNNCLFSKLEAKGNRVLYSPLCEYLFFLLSDFVYSEPLKESRLSNQNLSQIMYYIDEISSQFESETPFAPSLESLRQTADQYLGFYSGANGRYRLAKSISQPENCQGIISVSSMYENTGVIQNIVLKNSTLPILNFTFDGNNNPGEESKIDSFLYYL